MQIDIVFSYAITMDDTTSDSAAFYLWTTSLLLLFYHPLLFSFTMSHNILLPVFSC